MSEIPAKDLPGILHEMHVERHAGNVADKKAVSGTGGEDVDCPA